MDSGHRSHMLSIMLHIGSETGAAWSRFDTTVHRHIPELRELDCSIVM